jgi:uncharacterized membrane protein
VTLRRVAQVGLGAAAWLWVWAIVFAPAIVFPIGHFICHQRPDRSFVFHGHQFAVCARCTGLYLGAALAVPFAIVAAVPLSGARARWLLGLGAIPTALTWCLEVAGVAPFSNLSRFAAALPLGLAAAWLVFSVVATPRASDTAYRPSDIGRRSSAAGPRNA